MQWIASASMFCEAEMKWQKLKTMLVVAMPLWCRLMKYQTECVRGSADEHAFGATME
jgi:hypothetical protein